MVLFKFNIADDGQFPNNMALPVLFYKGALKLPLLFPAEMIRRLFKKHQWYNSWQSGIFTYQHYHSNTHEVMGCYRGQTELQLGGPHGVIITFAKGDVLIIPAGVAHKNLSDEHSVACVGAYPDGREYDMKRGRKDERPKADENIISVPLPAQDPLYGKTGELIKQWL